MAFVVADRVRDTTTTTGTGAVTVSAASPTGYRTFSTVLATNDILPYFIAHQSANEWEVGIGTYSAANQITRTTVTASSNAGAAVSFSAGTKDVVLSPIADPQTTRDVWSRGNATIVASRPLFDLAQTWNNVAVAFTGLRLNITDTTSSAASLLLDLQIGATSVFSVAKTGQILVTGSLNAGLFGLTNSDPGTIGAMIDLVHNSASPANADTPGVIRAFGRSSTAVLRQYGLLQTVITDTTNASEDATWEFWSMKAGTITQNLIVDPVNGIRSFPTVATPAGGTATLGYRLGSAGVGIYWGSGAPTLSAAQGSIYLRTDGGANTRIYSNSTGSTVWVAMTG